MSVSGEAPDGLAELLDYRLLEYARARTSSLSTVPILDEVRAKLFQIPGSMAELIIAERGEF